MWQTKLADYALLVKLKLSLVVVVSSVLGYLIVSDGNGLFIDIIKLVIGGFLVTGAANAINQVLEKDFDILMTRTANRPVATGRMKSSEAIMFAGISCLIGISILASFNPITAFLGMLSLIIYAFVYTPLKRYSTSAVAVGAIPGALPVLIGATAFDANISMYAFCLFIIQFLWQFPHFWSIGFVGFEDYKKAGYKLVPSDGEKIDRNLGWSSMVYATLIIPVVLVLYVFGNVSVFSTILVIFLTLAYMFLSYNLQKNFDRAAALKLMFFFFFLPSVLISYWLI
ncbi:MAG: protoheme IX farnesyltransferase [Saprospiraceae bacterium]|nr:protoheme IX farnesyltransferase [Saprospiraceae bacterium]